jgi:uncharacterized membrane protein
MALLILGLLLFLGVHSVRIVAEDWRGRRVARMGLKPWKGAVTVFSLIGFGLIVWGYGLARQTPVILYSPPVWTRHLAALLMVLSFVLVTAAYVPGTRIKRAVGHPMVAGVKTWAVAHLLANGSLADVVLFGSFLVWAIADYVSARRRDRAAGVVYVAGPITQDVKAVVIGIVAWVVFAFWLHGWLIGVRPLG